MTSLYDYVLPSQRKNASVQEKKKSRQIQSQQEAELKVFQAAQRKDYQKSKEAMRKVRTVRDVMRTSTFCGIKNEYYIVLFCVFA